MGKLSFILFLGITTFIAIRLKQVLVPLPGSLPDGITKRTDWSTKTAKDDTKIVPFKIDVSDTELDYLRTRLQSSRFTDFPIENSNFRYGFNVDYLKKVNQYWSESFDWRKWEKKLNSFDHFKTQIDGLSLHFIHAKAPVQKYKTVIPLLMSHGWPGSVWEFYKIIPMLTDPAAHGLGSYKFAFDVVAPSIPGYGWSEAPKKQKFGTIGTGIMFGKLMDRLSYKNYFVQGGDWGSEITAVTARVFADRVQGYHSNMCFLLPTNYPMVSVKQLIGAYLPGVLFSESDAAKMYPYIEKQLDLLQETGYMHIQATKPDTIGATLSDSPIGLAAYILEKYSTWTNPSFRDLPDGGLTKKWSLDELLTQIMIYWTTNTITSSQRFYKEFFRQEHFDEFGKIPVAVPSACLLSKYELAKLPKSLLEYHITNITRYTELDKGGHFLAFEEPKAVAEDIFNFVKPLI